MENQQCRIRSMLESDIQSFDEAFTAQGWHRNESDFAGYYEKQTQGRRQVFVAQLPVAVAGYVTLLPHAQTGPFQEKGYPEITDFNVFMPYQRQGIGSLLMDAVEAAAFEKSPVVTLGVGLHNGYGAAQRLYVRRGYMPDGSGVWYRYQNLPQYADCCNDDDLVLYLSKTKWPPDDRLHMAQIYKSATPAG